MRPAVLDIKSEGDLGGQKIALSLDTHSLAHIMSVLTDLYSDQAMAVIREYSTNAYDAHRLAGNDSPIEISTPNMLSPFFRVKDYGIGMTIDDVIQTYSKYGASSKRDSDDQNGTFGLGCKSGLTFSAQFTVIAIKDGIKIHVSVSRTPDGAGQMEVVNEVLTDEPNGVEVIVPVSSNEESFNKKVSEFFQYWREGTVLVNGVKPSYIGAKKKAVWLDDSTLLVPDEGKDVIVMGNVAYPANGLNIFSDSWKRPYRIVSWVEIGDVHIPPNREALIYSEQTKAVIARVRGAIAKDFSEKIQKEIDGATTYVEATRILLANWRSVAKDLDVRFDGHTLAEHPKMKDGTWHYEINGSGKSTNKVSDIFYSRPQFIVTGFDKVGGPTPHDRTKTRQYLRDIDSQATDILYMLVADERFSHLPSVDFDTIKAVKLEKSDGIKVFYKLGMYGRIEVTDDISDKPVLYYIPGNKKPKVEKLGQLTKEYNIIKLTVAAEKKFKEQFPKAEKLEQFLLDKFNIAKASLSEYDRLKHFSSYYAENKFNGLPADRIEDPELADFIRKTAGNKFSDEMNEYNKWSGHCYTMNVGVGRLNRTENRFANKYPLVNGNSYTDHAIIYINTIYQLEKNDN